MTPKNPLINLFQSIADVVNGYINKERAVNISAIYQTVQNKLDEGNAETDSLDGMMSRAYVLDIYVEEAGTFAIITKNDGKLYKIPVMVDADSQVTLGEEQLVVMDFTPVTSNRQVTIKRQADGKVRWFAMPACTAVLNRDGEIDSRALFDSFVEHIERTDNYPELDFFHLGESLPLGKADWVARDGVSYCASGLFYDTPIARAAIKSLEKQKDYWGLSIAYIPTTTPETLRSTEGIEIQVYNAGINRFISLLPEDTAASILTNISTKEEVNRMNKKVSEALKLLTGDDDALFKEISEKVDSVNRSADGMINRDKQAAETPAATEPQVRAMTPEEITAMLASDEFKAAVTAIVKEVYPESTNASDEEKQKAKEVTPPAATENRATDDVMKLLAELKTQVEGIATTRAAEVQELINDLPSKTARTTIIRPRATRMPEDVRNRQQVSLADIASQTLEKMGES